LTQLQPEESTQPEQYGKLNERQSNLESRRLLKQQIKVDAGSNRDKEQPQQQAFKGCDISVSNS